MNGKTLVTFNTTTSKYKKGQTGFVDGFFSGPNGSPCAAVIIEKPSDKPIKVKLGWWGEGEKRTKCTYVTAPLEHLIIVED